MRNLSPRARRALALGLLLLLVLAPGAIAWLPLRWIDRQDRRLAALDHEIAALRERIGEREQLLAEQRLLESALTDQALFVRAATPALAGAELQGLVAALVREQGGELGSTQVLEPTEAPPFLEIGLRVQLVIGLESLVGLLHAIETSRPLLLVRALDLRAREPAAEAGAPLLETVVELVGLARRG